MSGSKIEEVALAQFTVWSKDLLAKGHPATDILYSWETTDEATRDYWRTQARAAIEAMRKPTTLMLFFGSQAMVGQPVTGPDRVRTLEIGYNAMIDEALK